MKFVVVVEAALEELLSRVEINLGSTASSRQQKKRHTVRGIDSAVIWSEATQFSSCL